MCAIFLKGTPINYKWVFKSAVKRKLQCYSILSFVV